MRAAFLATAASVFLLTGACDNARGQTDSPAPAYLLETKPAKRVRGVMTYSARYDGLQAREWYVFVPQAPELPGQTKPKTKLEPAGVEIRDLGLLKRPLVNVRIPATTRDLKTTIGARVTYEATLLARRLVPAAPDQKPPAVADLTREARAAALAEGGQYDFRSTAVQKWVKQEGLLREKGEADLDLARRVFLALRAKYKYRGPTSFKASETCAKEASDCGGLSVLFASVLRANGVPARTLWGRWAESADPTVKLEGEPYYQTHVKAEFFVKGVGWVPVDLSSAIMHDRSQEGLAYFGQDAGDFLTLHVDTDLEVRAGPFGRKTVVGLQNPAWWVVGDGAVDNPKTTQDWKVETLP
jgi:transglutaminase-like putative cysteine protease